MVVGDESDSGDLEKLQRLKHLLVGAIRQIRKKLSVIETSIHAITAPADITNDTKIVCTILVEIREVNRNNSNARRLLFCSC